jgi:hypothetical protein
MGACDGDAVGNGVGMADGIGDGANDSVGTGVEVGIGEGSMDTVGAGVIAMHVVWSAFESGYSSEQASHDSVLPYEMVWPIHMVQTVPV